MPKHAQIGQSHVTQGHKRSWKRKVRQNLVSPWTEQTLFFCIINMSIDDDAWNTHHSRNTSAFQDLLVTISASFQIGNWY